MTIERCIECDNPTNDSRYVGDDGPFCETCFEWKEMVAEHKAVVEKLAAEVERLKAHTWEQERAAVVALAAGWIDAMSPSPNEHNPSMLARCDVLSELICIIERGEHWPEGETSWIEQ